MTIIGIDPGTRETGIVRIIGERITHHTYIDNTLMQDYLEKLIEHGVDLVSIEMIGHYGTGMPVGKDIFVTCLWIGILIETLRRLNVAVRLIKRKTITLHLCNSVRAKDGNVRQALLDRYPATGGGRVPQVGIKSNPGPLFGISGDQWSALAVALYTLDNYSEDLLGGGVFSIV